VKSVQKAIKEFEDLIAREIIRNNLELIKHLEKDPSMLISQALKINRARVLEICNSLRIRNYQRAYEIVALCKGLDRETIRKMYNNAKQTAKRG
jgi:hypothetical protein